MNKTANKLYAQRLSNVIDYIYDHLDEDLSIERLSQIANFSRFHFHRQFSTYTGITVFKLVQLIRLRRAAYQLVNNAQESVLNIALDAHFQSGESFSRTFKKSFGQTPSQFRKSPEQAPWKVEFRIPPYHGKHNMNVSIVNFKETKVAALEHRKSPERVNESVDTFIQWREENDYSPANSKAYGIIYDDPEGVAPEDFRFDLCGEVTKEVTPNTFGIIPKLIPAGKCAVLRHEGSLDNIGDTVCYMYSKWLPDSGEELRDFPCFFHYVKHESEVPENEQITDIYLPIR